MSVFVLRYHGREFDLPAGDFRIGRDPACDMTVKGRLASRHHAVLRISETVTVEDLGSSNGVFVNGERIDGQSAVGHGDRIYVGLHEFHLFEKARRPAADGHASDADDDVSGQSDDTTVHQGRATAMHPNELRVLRLFALGCSNDYVAARMDLSGEAVHRTRERILGQLGIVTDDDLRRVAQELGLLPPS